MPYRLAAWRFESATGARRRLRRTLLVLPFQLAVLRLADRCPSVQRERPNPPASEDSALFLGCGCRTADCGAITWTVQWRPPRYPCP
jgi:hypothetical protein